MTTMNKNSEIYKSRILSDLGLLLKIGHQELIKIIFRCLELLVYSVSCDPEN